jgi:general secretion pathway protein I
MMALLPTATPRTIGRDSAGFTLLEVLMAMAILAVSLVVIFDTNGTSVRMAAYSRDMTHAALLARSKMLDLEWELRKEGYSEFPEEMDGDFSDEGDEFERYSWTATIEKVEFPFEVPCIDGQSITIGPIQLDLCTVANQFKGMGKELSEAVREVKLVIAWKEGGRDRSIDVTSHFLDWNRLKMITGSSPLAALGNAAGALQSGKGGVALPGAGGSSGKAPYPSNRVHPSTSRPNSPRQKPTIDRKGNTLRGKGSPRMHDLAGRLRGRISP